VRSLAKLLFKKELKIDRSLCRSFEKSDCAIVHTIRLFKRATKRAIAPLLFQKECKSKNEQKMCNFSNRSFFALKKAIAHFQNERMPKPALFFFHL